MKSKSAKRIHVIRLFKGEKVMESVAKFCKAKKINGASFQGIGAVLEGEIGVYDLANKKYLWRPVKEPMEMVSITGNVALLDGKQVLHAHAILSDDETKVIGGHVKELTVGPTCEIVLIDLGTKLERTYDKEIGLNLLKL